MYNSVLELLHLINNVMGFEIKDSEKMYVVIVFVSSRGLVSVEIFHSPKSSSLSEMEWSLLRSNFFPRLSKHSIFLISSFFREHAKNSFLEISEKAELGKKRKMKINIFFFWFHNDNYFFL